MTAYQVDLAELQAVVVHLDAGAQALAERLAQLEEVVRAGRADWTGEAADAQARAHLRIMAGAQRIRAALTGLHAAARQAHDSYAAAATANAATWRQVDPGT